MSPHDLELFNSTAKFIKINICKHKMARSNILQENISYIDQFRITTETLMFSYTEIGSTTDQSRNYTLLVIVITRIFASISESNQH